MAESVITDEMRAMIGKPLGRPYVAGEVDRGSIMKFATAVGDTNPLWTDEEYARGTRWGGTMAPPTYLISISPQATLADGHSPSEAETALPFKKPFRRGFSSGDEWEAFRPVRPGDVLTVSTVLADLVEKQGRPGVGRMLFIQTDNTIRNQRDEVVAIHRYTSVSFEGPAD